jgi:flavodoxin
MKALVMYDTKHGSTERIAKAIADGLKQNGFESVDCRLRSLSGEEDFRDKDLWVLGTPTHYGRVPFRFATLVKNALREEHPGVKTAVFDTHMKGFPEGASVKLRKLLENKKKQVVAEGSFVVEGMRGPLLEGEEERALQFGKDLAGSFKN